MSDDSKTMVSTVAEFLGLKPAELTLKDVQKPLPELRRKMMEYEREALTAEAESGRFREVAFSPDTPQHERAGKMRQAKQASDKAQMKMKQTMIFHSQYANFSALESTMQIVDQMREVGLIQKGIKIDDWQKVVDEMQSEMETITKRTQQLTDAMSVLMHHTDSSVDTSVNNELDLLFDQWNKATDPVEKMRIQKKIDEKTGFVTA